MDPGRAVAMDRPPTDVTVFEAVATPLVAPIFALVLTFAAATTMVLGKGLLLDITDEETAEEEEKIVADNTV